MRVQSMLAVGFLAVTVASGVVKVPDSFASEAQRMGINARIGAGGSIYQPISVQSGDAKVAGTERGKVDVITRSGIGGSTYASRRPAGGVSECVACEGVVYPYSKPTSH
ncbi:MAG: hypothetical protein LV473_17555 [Nitrospira sp.]|nr:hypothetical protein [Nitrospira sp.]